MWNAIVVFTNCRKYGVTQGPIPLPIDYRGFLWLIGRDRVTPTTFIKLFSSHAAEWVIYRLSHVVRYGKLLTGIIVDVWNRGGVSAGHQTLLNLACFKYSVSTTG